MPLKIERQARIQRLVEEKKQVTVAELSAMLRVSEATIRRDLDDMDGEVLQRTHGGAVVRQRFSAELPVVQRLNHQSESKRRIGQAAAELIRDGETIFISSGTTAFELARALPTAMRLNVITNSILVVNELANRQNIELMIIGGMFRKSELSMVGHTADLVITEFRANRTFMGMRAIDPRFGFTNDYMPEVQTDRAIINMASQIVVMADHTKFGQVYPVFVAPVTAAQIIITDQHVDTAIVHSLQELNVKMMIV
jgi:DeoR/GlpR family transcriptional regulator of sugar metabolism